MIEKKLPISHEVSCLYNVFAFDIEICNVVYSKYCEPYATGLYQPNKLYECFNGDLNKENLAIERSKVHVFLREISNPVLKMIDYVKNTYAGKPKKVVN